MTFIVLNIYFPRIVKHEMHHSIKDTWIIIDTKHNHKGSVAPHTSARPLSVAPVSVNTISLWSSWLHDGASHSQQTSNEQKSWVVAGAASGFFSVLVCVSDPWVPVSAVSHARSPTAEAESYGPVLINGSPGNSIGWVRGAEAEGKAGHRGPTWMLSSALRPVGWTRRVERVQLDIKSQLLAVHSVIANVMGTLKCAEEDFVFYVYVTQTTLETSCNYVWWVAPRRLNGSNNTDGGLQKGKQLREPNMGVPRYICPDIIVVVMYLFFSCQHIWEGRMIFLNWPKWWVLWIWFFF